MNRDREVESTINQTITRQVTLNYLKAKIDNTKSDKCDFRTQKKQYSTAFFECEQYNSHREVLEREVESILASNDIKITVINLKVLTGNLDDSNRLINNKLEICFWEFPSIHRQTHQESLIYLVTLSINSVFFFFFFF